MSKKSIGREAEARHSESNGSPAPGLEMRTALLLLACTGVDARRRAQGAAMVGGSPPKAIVTTFCSIGDVYAHMCARRKSKRNARPPAQPFASTLAW